MNFFLTIEFIKIYYMRDTPIYRKIPSKDHHFTHNDEKYEEIVSSFRHRYSSIEFPFIHNKFPATERMLNRVDWYL